MSKNKSQKKQRQENKAKARELKKALEVEEKEKAIKDQAEQLEQAQLQQNLGLTVEEYIWVGHMLKTADPGNSSQARL